MTDRLVPGEVSTSVGPATVEVERAGDEPARDGVDDTGAPLEGGSPVDGPPGAVGPAERGALGDSTLELLGTGAGAW